MSETTETPKPPTRGPDRVTSKDAWAKRGVHEGVTLPSGAVVDIKLPNLPLLIKSGTLPNPLLAQALESRKQTEIDREWIERNWEFTIFIVPRTVVSPEVTEDDVASGDLPVEDLEQIVAFASRTTDMDAVGRHIGGLDTVKSFRDARGIFTLDPDSLDS